MVPEARELVDQSRPGRRLTVRVIEAPQVLGRVEDPRRGLTRSSVRPGRDTSSA
jgi:hypothetical protein